MSLQHALPQELDLFTSNPYQLAIESFEEHQLSPLNAIDSSTSVIEFFSHGYQTKLKSLDSIYLQATLKLTKANGDSYDESESQGFLANSALTSLIKSCNLYLNNQLVMSINDHFGIQEFIQLSLNFDKSTTSARLSNQGFFNTSDEDKQKALLKGSKEVELIAKLNMMNTEKFLLSNVSLGLKLTLQNPDFYIIENTTSSTASGVTTETTSNSKLKIVDMKLYLKHAILRPELLYNQEMMLSKKYKAVYEWKYGAIYTTTISPNLQSFSITSIYNNIRPSFLLLAFVENTTFLGNRKTNPLVFTHHGLSSVNFTINNESVPKTPLTMSSNKYSRLFNQLYQSLGIHNENTTTLVDKENFLTNFFYVTADISPGQNALTSLNNPIDVVNIGFNATFHAKLPNALTAILYVLLPRKVEIGLARDITVVY